MKKKEAELTAKLDKLCEEYGANMNIEWDRGRGVVMDYDLAPSNISPKLPCAWLHYWLDGFIMGYEHTKVTPAFTEFEE